MVTLHPILHRGSEECGIAKDVQDVLTGGHQDGLTLSDFNAIDVGFSPKTDHDDERIAVEIHLLSHLHHHAMHHEVWTVDELRRGLGAVVRGAISRPYLVVDGLLGLLDMQFPRVAMHILSPEVINPIGDVNLPAGRKYRSPS